MRHALLIISSYLLVFSSFAIADDGPVKEEAQTKVFISSSLCDSVDANGGHSHWLAGKSYVVRESDFKNGRLSKTLSENSTNLNLSLYIFGPPDRRRISAGLHLSDTTQGRRLFLNTSADVGSVVVSRTGACEEAADIGTVELSISLRPVD